MYEKKIKTQKNVFEGRFAGRVHNLPPRVGPGSKLEVALLVVKGKPGDVNLASRLERIGVSILTIIV